MTSENNKRIAKNTLLLYFRMILTMVISLYTSRIVLNSLGVTDFGIYNVVGGVVAMFSLISGALSSSVSRFLTYELGLNNAEKLKRIFSTSVTIHIVLAILILILAETLGVWFLNAKMNIPADRMISANWVLQCSVLTFLINIISVPYNAAIIAHEHMKAFAYVSIIEVTLKLLVVFLLYVLPFDKLTIYAMMLVGVALIIRIIYGVYCKRNFEECSIKFSYDKVLIKEMTSFAGWNFIGASSALLRDQGVNILLNLFCGPIINAARGIAVQVNMAINSFVGNFMTALNPQITKSYAANDHHYMMNLVFQGARFSFYLLLFLSLPVLIETEQILTVWLKLVPAHTISFVRLILVFAMLESLSGTLVTAMLATGKIRNYQIVVGGLQLLNFPLSYFFLKLGFFPEITLVIAIGISISCLVARLYMLRRMINLSVNSYLTQVVGNAFAVAGLSLVFPYLIYSVQEAGLIRFLTICLVCAINTVLIIYWVGCSAGERQFIGTKVAGFKGRIFSKTLKSSTE